MSHTLSLNSQSDERANLRMLKWTSDQTEPWQWLQGMQVEP